MASQDEPYYATLIRSLTDEERTQLTNELGIKIDDNSDYKTINTEIESKMNDQIYRKYANLVVLRANQRRNNMLSPSEKQQHQTIKTTFSSSNDLPLRTQDLVKTLQNRTINVMKNLNKNNEF